MIVAKVLLAANEYDGKARAEMKDFGNPLQVNKISAWFVLRSFPFSLFVTVLSSPSPSSSSSSHFGDRVSRYLFLYVVERIRGINGEADEDDVRIGVGKWAKAIIIFLTCRIP